MYNSEGMKCLKVCVLYFHNTPLHVMFYFFILQLSNVVRPVTDGYRTFAEQREKNSETLKETSSENVNRSQRKQQKAYVKHMQKKYKNVTFDVGNEVLLYNARKSGRKGSRMAVDFSGPYTIHNISGKKVSLTNQDGHLLKTTYNINNLKPYKRSHLKEDITETSQLTAEILPVSLLKPETKCQMCLLDHQLSSGFNLK